jgi:hypothetical protein
MGVDGARSPGGAVTELAGEPLRQARLSMALFGDWRKHYDAANSQIRVNTP